MTDTLQQKISIEVTGQLLELKAQLNKEMLEDMRELQQAIVASVTESIMAAVDKKIDDAVKKAVARSVLGATKDMKKSIETSCSQKIDDAIRAENATRGMQIMKREETAELVLSVGQQVQTQVLKTVMNEINTKVVPKVNNMVQWVNYNMQDGAGVVDEYRREVEKQHFDPTVKMLTDGKKDSRVISPYVRTVWGDDD